MGKTILIVEGEHILREVLQDFFVNESYHVLEAVDGLKVDLTYAEFKIY